MRLSLNDTSAARQAGLRIYGHSQIQLGHVGTMCFQANVQFPDTTTSAVSAGAAADVVHA